MRPGFSSRFLRTSAGITVVLVTVGALLWVLFAALRPLPGRDVTIATGPPGSVYVQSAERYRELQDKCREKPEEAIIIRRTQLLDCHCRRWDGRSMFVYRGRGGNLYNAEN